MRHRAAVDLAKSLTISPNEAVKAGLLVNMDGRRRSAFELLSYPNNDLATLAAIWPELRALDERTAESLAIEASYSVYLDRQSADIDQLRREEARSIPADFDYAHLPGLSNELKQKLALRRPDSIAAAERIEGMTPAAMAIVVSRIRDLERGRSAA